MEYRGVEYAVRARPGRDEWLWTIYPTGAPAFGRQLTGTRDRAVTHRRGGRSTVGLRNKRQAASLSRGASIRSEGLGFERALPCAQIDAWAARQEDNPPRSEAIQRMVERQLAAEPEAGKPPRKGKL
jgi:hypothetical protein